MMIFLYLKYHIEVKPFVDVIENARSLALELLGLENKGYTALFFTRWVQALNF